MPDTNTAPSFPDGIDAEVWEEVDENSAAVGLADEEDMLLTNGRYFVRREPTPTMPVLPSESGAVNARAYDMGKHQRVIGVESDLISGRVIALGRIRSRDDVLVTAIDLTIWDELRTGGRVFGPNDLSGFVQTDGAVNLRLPHDPHRRSEVEDARAEVDHAFKLAAEEFMRATEEQR